MLKKFELDFDAIKYVKYSLAQGSTISQELLSLPIEKGNVTTYLPSTTTKSQRNNFEVGGLIKNNEVHNNLIYVISDYLSTNTENLAIFETLARPGDKWIQASKCHIITYDQSEVYNFIAPNIADYKEIDTAIRHSRSYPFIGILTHANNKQINLSSSVSITKKQINELVKKTCCILIGAYDDEAVLVWQPIKKE